MGTSFVLPVKKTPQGGVGGGVGKEGGKWVGQGSAHMLKKALLCGEQLQTLKILGEGRCISQRNKSCKVEICCHTPTPYPLDKLASLECRSPKIPILPIYSYKKSKFLYLLYVVLQYFIYIVLRYIVKENARN